MLSSHKTLLRQKDELYEILEVFSIGYFYDEEEQLKRDLFEWWKKILSADIALKNESKFFFCKKIEELEFQMVPVTEHSLIGE